MVERTQREMKNLARLSIINLNETNFRGPYHALFLFLKAKAWGVWLSLSQIVLSQHPMQGLQACIPYNYFSSPNWLLHLTPRIEPFWNVSPLPHHLCSVWLLSNTDRDVSCLQLSCYSLKSNRLLSFRVPTRAIHPQFIPEGAFIVLFK